MLIKLTEGMTQEECIINTDLITTMMSEGPQWTVIHFTDGNIVVSQTISEIITIIEKGGNIYDEKGEA